ncbi:phage tail tape measure protein [Kitasatospora sp. NPDC059571]|uniref:phage tail tape measure protein n=1 Tax=Kitasatospora sp. NPDC059571 TaxID=3346871 RepID=UPI0036BD1B6A
MTDRTVNVRLNLDNSGTQRAATQSEQSYRRIAQAAADAGAQQQSAFQAAATGSQRAMERTAAVAQASGRTTQESMRATAAGAVRLAEAAEGIPGAFASAATLTERAMQGMAASATSAANAVVVADTRMTEASVASAQGITASLAVRLAAGQGVIASQAAIAASAQASATVQVGAFARAAAAVTAWGTSMRTSAATGFRTLTTAAEQGEKAFTGLRTAGLLMLGMFAAASVTAARFEKAMSGVYAVAGATAEEMGQLREAALAAGRDTAYTASQAADAEGELARAGVSVADIVGGALSGALSLAAAGQLSLGESATIAAQAMNVFGLHGKDVGHIADVLAAAANKSASDVHGLGESLRSGGLLAHQTGLSLEDTAAVLSVFADHALVGSDAGTSLKTMLQRLTPQSTEAANLMAKLGFSAYDTSGQFVGLSALAGNMQRSFSQLTPEARNAAMGVIFGSDAVRAANILYEQGTLGIDEYRKAVDDNGAAARMAAVQMDNLAGDLQYLKGSLEVALIQSGTEANKVLRDMVKIVNEVVTAYAALPAWAQGTAVAIAAVGGAVAVAAGSFMLMLPRIAAFQASITALSTTMPRLASAASLTMKALGPLGIALTLATVALGVFGGAQKDAKKTTEDLTAAVKADGNAIGANTRAWVAHELETKGVLKAAKDLQLNTSDLTEAILGNSDAAARFTASLAPLTAAGNDAGHVALSGIGANKDWQKSLDLVKGSFNDMTGQVNDAVGAAIRESEAVGTAAGSTNALGKAVSSTGDDMKDTRSETEKLSDALDGLNGKNIDSAKAAISLQTSLADLKKAVKENGTSLDINSEKGRAVKSAFLDAAEAAMKHAEAVSKQTGSTDEANIVLAKDIDMLKETMHQAGFTSDQITALTAAYAQVPETVTTKVTDPQALKTIEDLKNVKKAVQDVPPGKTIDVTAPNEQAIGDLEAIGYKVDHLPNGKVRVTVPTNDAFDGATKIQDMINGITGRTVRVTVTGETIFVGGKGQARLAEADGGVLHYAQGGIRAFASGAERHIAQIAPAGAMRLWAEPETGGEAYIPLAAGKRGRSTAILGDVANRFGYRLVPVGQLTGGGGGTASYDHSRSVNVTLNGARQTSAEQLADLARHLDFVS